MTAPTAGLLHLTLYEAQQVFTDTAYKSFIKALGRPRRAYDCHVLSIPQIKMQVLTCRVVGTDNYTSPNKIKRHVTPYDMYPELRKVGKRPITTYVDPVNQYPVDIHYDMMSTEKQNVVTVGDMVDMLSVYTSADVSLLDCVRLYLLRRPPLDYYFTSSHFIQESKVNVDFLRQVEDLAQYVSDQRLFHSPGEAEAFSFFTKFSVINRLSVLSALDIRWTPSKALAITDQYSQDIKNYALRGRLSGALLLDSLKELCVYLCPFAPDTASRLWKILWQPDLPNKELSEQPWPTELSALSGLLRVTFHSEVGTTIRVKVYSLTPQQVDSLNTEWLATYISNSTFFRHMFKRGNQIKYIWLAPDDYGYGYKAKVTLFPPDQPPTGSH